MILRMSYHRFNNLAELINGTLPQKPDGEYFLKNSWIDNVTVLFYLKSTESVSKKVNTGLSV